MQNFKVLFKVPLNFDGLKLEKKSFVGGYSILLICSLFNHTRDIHCTFFTLLTFLLTNHHSGLNSLQWSNQHRILLYSFYLYHCIQNIMPNKMYLNFIVVNLKWCSDGHFLANLIPLFLFYSWIYFFKIKKKIRGLRN